VFESTLIYVALIIGIRAVSFSTKASETPSIATVVFNPLLTANKELTSYPLPEAVFSDEY
jgi:hypothetical protein